MLNWPVGSELVSGHNSLYRNGMARSPNREIKFFYELDEVFGVYKPRVSHKQNPTVPTPRVEVENQGEFKFSSYLFTKNSTGTG